MYIAWDKRINYKETNFRKEILKGEYKATRDQTGQADLYNQIDSIFPVLESLGLRNVFPYVLEGDDTIAWLSQNIKGMNIIISVVAVVVNRVMNTFDMHFYRLYCCGNKIALITYKFLNISMTRFSMNLKFFFGSTHLD